MFVFLDYYDLKYGVWLAGFLFSDECGSIITWMDYIWSSMVLFMRTEFARGIVGFVKDLFYSGDSVLRFI